MTFDDLHFISYSEFPIILNYEYVWIVLVIPTITNQSLDILECNLYFTFYSFSFE